VCRWSIASRGAQDEDLDVLGSVAAEAQRHPGQQLREQLVDQLRRHLRIM
jgi:hypothetical protein